MLRRSRRSCVEFQCISFKTVTSYYQTMTTEEQKLAVSRESLEESLAGVDDNAERHNLAIILLPAAVGDGSKVIKQLIPSLMTTISKNTRTFLYVCISSDREKMDETFHSAIESFNAKENEVRNGIEIKLCIDKNINDVARTCAEDENSIIGISNDVFIFKATGWTEAIRMALTMEDGSKIVATPCGSFIAVSKKHTDLFNGDIKMKSVREWNFMTWLLSSYKMTNQIVKLPPDSIEISNSIVELDDGETKSGEKENLQQQIIQTSRLIAKAATRETD